MKLCVGWAFSLAAAAVTGCASQALDCSGRRNACEATFGDCDPAPAACRDIPAGVSYGLVNIDTSPTSALIYVDGARVGVTPLKHPLYVSNQTRYVIVVAEPTHPNQTRQEKRLRVPPLPNRIQFFMNNPATDDASEGGGR